MNWRKVWGDKGGHRLFVDADQVSGRLRVWVADRSGSTPDTTDDGPLEIRFPLDGIELHPSHGHLIASVPVRKAKSLHTDFTVGLSVGCARHLAKLWSLPITIRDPETGEVFHPSGRASR